MVTSMLFSLGAAAIAARNRTPGSDEGSFSSASYNLAQHGFLGTTVIESAGTKFTRIEQRTYWVMPLYLLGQALWYKLAPASLFATRFFTILWIPAALLAFYFFLNRLLPNSGAPPLGVCLLALSFNFMDNAGLARPDFMCCTLGLGGLAAYLALRERHLNRALFVANCLVAASVLTHPNGIYYLAALAVLVVWFDRRRMGPRQMLPASMPYVLFGAVWSIYVLQDLPAFLDQMGANAHGRWTATLNPLAILWREIGERYLLGFGLITRGLAIFKAYALVTYITGVAGCLASRRLRQQRSTRLLLTLLAVYFAAMCLFNQKLSYYLIHIVPFYIALLAVWSAHLWTSQPRLRLVLCCSLGILVALETGGIVFKSRLRSYLSLQRPAVKFVLAHTKPTGRIVGTAALLYEMGFDPRLRDDPDLGLNSERTPDVIVVEPIYRVLYGGWRAERPVDMHRIERRLSSYTLAYRSGEYDVCLAPSHDLQGGAGVSLQSLRSDVRFSSAKVRARDEWTGQHCVVGESVPAGP